MAEGRFLSLVFYIALELVMVIFRHLLLSGVVLFHAGHSLLAADVLLTAGELMEDEDDSREVVESIFLPGVFDGEQPVSFSVGSFRRPAQRKKLRLKPVCQAPILAEEADSPTCATPQGDIHLPRSVDELDQAMRRAFVDENERVHCVVALEQLRVTRQITEEAYCHLAESLKEAKSRSLHASVKRIRLNEE
ncbi:hypothetical protein EBZ39_09805 [bacterium]|nr:hypothetical protein [bacterium]